MDAENDEKKPSQKPLFSSLLDLPFFQETSEEDTRDQGEEMPDILSIQKALINYFLNLPAFQELEDSDQEKFQE